MYKNEKKKNEISTQNYRVGKKLNGLGIGRISGTQKKKIYSRLLCLQSHFILHLSLLSTDKNESHPCHKTSKKEITAY